MATKAPLNPPTFRYPFDLKGESPVAQQAHLYAFNGLLDLNQAFAVLKTQIDSKVTTPTTAAAATENVTNTSQTVVVTPNTIGMVNNQSGVTAYATLPSDYGAFLILSDASPIAITLSVATMIQIPWYASFINLGTGTATLTPASGSGALINGAAFFSLPGNNAVTVAYDGTNFWVEPMSAEPQNTPAVLHEWINAYNSTTGVFSQIQPAFTDISGAVAPAQLPTPTVSTLGGVEANTPVAHEWVNAINTAGIPQLSRPVALDVVPASSTTGGRPAGVTTGFMDFDTTLGIPIWWSGSTWVNASGTPV